MPGPPCATGKGGRSALPCSPPGGRGLLLSQAATRGRGASMVTCCALGMDWRHRRGLVLGGSSGFILQAAPVSQVPSPQPLHLPCGSQTPRAPRPRPEAGVGPGSPRLRLQKSVLAQHGLLQRGQGVRDPCPRLQDPHKCLPRFAKTRQDLPLCLLVSPRVSSLDLNSRTVWLHQAGWRIRWPLAFPRMRFSARS